MVIVSVRIRYSVWLVSGYAHVFLLLSVVIVPYPVEPVWNYTPVEFQHLHSVSVFTLVYLQHGDVVSC